MGAGPGHLLDQGLAETLAREGHRVEIERIRLPGAFLTEVTSGVEAMRRVARAVTEARRRGRFPIVLSGHCGISLGTVCGLGVADTGLLWFDAHGDLNTPAVSPSGYFDGMGFAMLLGHGWEHLASTVPGFAPLPPGQAALLGARDLDPGEEALIAEIGLVSLSRAETAGPEAAALDRLAAAVRHLHVHVDLDAFDPEVVRGNDLATPGGFDVEEIVAVVRTAARRAPVVSVGVASYDPTEDAENRGPAVVGSLLAAILAI